MIQETDPVESHALIDYLKYKNIMLFDTIETLENKLKESEDLLKKFSSDNLKSMLCIHLDISNKPDLIVDDLSASTSHASDSELDSIVIKPVIVDSACLDNYENSCLNNCVKPKSKDIGTQAHGKFVRTCHNCGKVGHIRPILFYFIFFFFLLKTHRSWIKQDALKKGKVEKSSSSKYVPSHRRHIKGKDSVIWKNANLKSVETVKKHSNKRSMPTCHHYGITGHIRPKEGSGGAANKSYIKHSTSYGTSGSTASAEVCSYQSKWQTKEEQIKALQEKATEA